MAASIVSLCWGRIGSKHAICSGLGKQNILVPLTTQTCLSILRNIHTDLSRGDTTSPRNNSSATNTRKKGFLCVLPPTAIQHVRHKVTRNRKELKVLKGLVGESFEYSGDLRVIKDFPEDTILYPYEPLGEELENDEVLRKLASLQFANEEQKYEHKKKLVVDRIITLFGHDSDLEQRIAVNTLDIRLAIPQLVPVPGVRQDKAKKFRTINKTLERRDDLAHLRKTDHERFEWLLRELKIRYVIPKDGDKVLGVFWKDVATDETMAATATAKRKKLEQLKAQFDKEKKDFFEHKAKVLAEMDQDLKRYGLTRAHLNAMIEEDKDRANPREYKDYTWEERVQRKLCGRLNKLV